MNCLACGAPCGANYCQACHDQMVSAWPEEFREELIDRDVLDCTSDYEDEWP